MSIINALNTASAYSGYARSLLDKSSGDGQSGTTSDDSTGTGATLVTLSAAARAALAASGTKTTGKSDSANSESPADLLTRTKADVKTLATKAGQDAIDLSSLDRRQIYAVAANFDGSFDADTVAAAQAEMKLRLGDALRGPEAAAQITDRLGGLYTAADTFLDAAGPEEKASDAWAARKAAVAAAEKRLTADPDADTSGIANDPVSEYFAGKTDGSTVRPARDFAAVASDARVLIDTLKKATGTSDAGSLDLSGVDGRSLAAVALNEGDAFDFDEVRAAKQELRARSRADLIATLKTGTDPRALSLGIVSQYAGMSSEERSALGWSADVQASAVASYEHTSQVLNILSGTATGAGARLMSLAAYLK